jgi:hypothetical protein
MADGPAKLNTECLVLDANLPSKKRIIGARAEEWAWEARDKVYSQAGFLEHFRWCEQAQLLWKMSEAGTRRPGALPEVARRGGFFNLRE